MINKIKKIIKKFFNSKNIYNFFIKLGIQKKKFLKKKFLLKNCLINTWVKIIKKNNNFFFFGYSNSLFLSGLIKIFFIILNNNNIKNIKILLKFNILNILKIKNKITNFKKESFNNVLNYINIFIKYN
ncbi:MAG: SufE family protein [Candidatus Carsonella ruddii]